MSGSIQKLKKRIRSVKNIQKITRSLQLVAVSKMQAYQDLARHTTRYMDQLLGILQDTNIKKVPKVFNEFFKTQKGKSLYIVLAPTRGFTGTLIANYNRMLKHNPSINENSLFLGVHKKASDILKASIGRSLDFYFEKELTKLTPENIQELYDFIMHIYRSYPVSSIFLIYPRFINVFTYEIKVEQYLPVPTVLPQVTSQSVTSQSAAGGQNQNITSQSQQSIPYKIEPSKKAFIKKVLDLYLQGYLMYALSNLNASEFSARMIHMKQATENAQSLTYALQLEFNKLRQQSITNTIMDVVRSTL